jgi:hypothetical protein
MSRNYIPLNQVVNDFVVTLDTDDYVSYAPDNTIRSFALRGLREMGFDMLKVVRSLKLPVSSNNTVTLPDDFVDWCKVGVVGTDGLVYVMSENDNVNMSQIYSESGGYNYDTDGDGLYDREDSKSATNGGSPTADQSITDGMESQGWARWLSSMSLTKPGLQTLGSTSMLKKLLDRLSTTSSLNERPLFQPTKRLELGRNITTRDVRPMLV